MSSETLSPNHGQGFNYGFCGAGTLGVDGATLRFHGVLKTFRDNNSNNHFSHGVHLVTKTFV